LPLGAPRRVLQPTDFLLQVSLQLAPVLDLLGVDTF